MPKANTTPNPIARKTSRRSPVAARGGPAAAKTQYGEIAALDRAVQLLAAVAQTVAPTPLNIAAQRTGLSKATAFRILSTLAAEGLVAQDDATSSYRLGVEPLRLATAVLESMPVRAVARQPMRTLSQTLNETVVLSVRDADTRVNIDAVECSNAISTGKRYGEPRPLHAGAAGRALLATLSDAEVDAYLERTEASNRTPAIDRTRLMADIADIRKRGFCSTMAELSLEAHAIAAPIKAPYGTAIAALHVAIPRTRMSAAVERRCTRALKAAVSEIERALSAATEAN